MNERAIVGAVVEKRNPRKAIFLYCGSAECFGWRDECRRRTEKRLMECAIDGRKEAFVANKAIRLLCCFRAPSLGHRCPENRVGTQNSVIK